ncbi:MAG: neutral/alkaline non-lysosomal ceramidase N-terminal domain-containing protein [Clostridia bacterium]|nr:neutral/alkaline non-lysosomal ceramidase N-terminal domain-containing protein [Clostridia bacterium]
MKEKYNLMCGAGRADITPPLGTILHGYAPGRPAESLGDGLTVTAILVRSDEDIALLISCTLCSNNEPLARELCALAGEAAGVPAENVIVNTTHTHSGPNTGYASAWGKVNYEYIETILKPATVQAAKQARETLQPAKVGFGETESDIGVNRRELTEDGKIVLGQNPWGPRDMRMTVISFKGADEKIIANIIHYCCHGTASGMNPEITRDWPGVMTDMLEEESGGITGFYAGVEGDQGPNLPNGKTTGNYKMALRLGARAGTDAVRAFRTIKDWRDVPVKVLHGTIRVPFQPLEAKEKAIAEMEKLGSLDKLYAEKRYSEVNNFIHWQQVLEAHESGKPHESHWTFVQTIVTIGPAAIIPTPFEAFVEIGLRLRRNSPYQYTLSLCNGNGCIAYLPTLGEIARGGYEIWQFTSGFRTLFQLPENTDDYWVKQNLEILRK